MIKAQDLRIGNVFRGIGGVQTVLSLEENTDRGKCNYSNEEHRLMYSHLILCHQNGNQYKPFEIEPIQLTEEILLKVGFVEDEPYLELEISPGYGIQYYQYKTDKNKISIYSGTTVISNHCKYLHQLQNLYFSLTGGDLDTSRLL